MGRRKSASEGEGDKLHQAKSLEQTHRPPDARYIRMQGEAPCGGTLQVWQQAQHACKHMHAWRVLACSWLTSALMWFTMRPVSVCCLARVLQARVSGEGPSSERRLEAQGCAAHDEQQRGAGMRQWSINPT